MNYRAGLTTRFALDSDGTLESSQPVTVFGMTFANANTEAVEINYQEDAVSPSVKGTVVVPCKSTVVVDIEFIADKGLVFCSVPDSGANLGSNVVVTVFHSHPGA